MGAQGVSMLVGSIVFLVLCVYRIAGRAEPADAVLETAILAGYVTGAFKWKSRWSFLLFHTTLRLAAQSVAIAFAVLGYSASGALVAFLVLAAEGCATVSPDRAEPRRYFSLVLCAYRWLIVWHQAVSMRGLLTEPNPSWPALRGTVAAPLMPHFDSAQARRESFLEPRKLLGQKWWQRFAASLSPRIFTHGSAMVAIHYGLIVGNALIITGSTRLGNAFDGPNNSFDPSGSSASSARALAGAGQAIFLCMILAFAAALLFTVRRISIPELGRIHPTLRLLGLVTPLLIVRGAWGIVQAVDLSQSFASPESYGPGGLRGEFVAKEYALATLMEWLSACLLLSTWTTSRNDDALAHAHQHATDPASPRSQSDIKLDRVTSERPAPL